MKLRQIFEQDDEQYLHWHVVARMGTRSVSYAKRDMIRNLENAGCEVTENKPGKYASNVLDVKRHLKDGEDPRKVRQLVTRAIKRVDPRAPYKFLGLKND